MLKRLFSGAEKRVLFSNRVIQDIKMAMSPKIVSESVPRNHYETNSDTRPNDL